MDGWSYANRIQAIRAAKLEQTREKQALIGAMDFDDHALILPPPEIRELVQTISGSGMPITDVRMKGFTPISNHPSGGFFGAKAVGANFRRLLEMHPVYIDPNSSLAGGYMVNFGSYFPISWNPDFDYSFLLEDINKYKLSPGIGARQHFCQDLAIGLQLGWGGILAKIYQFRQVNNAPQFADFYSGLADVALGIQDWIRRTALTARSMAEVEQDPLIQQNLAAIAAINQRMVSEPPQTFREALQWILWYQVTARMYNGSGSLGRLDVLLQPFFEREIASGALTEEEATFHIACLLVRDTGYLQLGGPDAQGRDVTSRLSYLVLEAAHWLKIPVNVGVSVGEDVDPLLLRRGVEILFADKTGVPKFLGVERTAEGFARCGYPLELGRERAYSGCHWSAIPGREYTMNDCVKINLAAVFEYTFNESMAGSQPPSLALLWERFAYHLERAVEATARCIDFHLAHQQQVFPELVLDLLCYGPIERGLDASHGGVDYYNLGIDGAALATAADSFAAIEQRIEKEQRLTWQELKRYLDTNWAGTDGERARLMLRSIPRYGQGGSVGDDYASRISRLFTDLVRRKPTPNGFNLIPGLFSWANTIPMGKQVGATPNGRRAGDPISHGSNPDPGFRADGAPTAMAVAIASVQPGFGNTAPMQLELDPLMVKNEAALNSITSLISGHFKLGGTQINANIMDSAKILAAHKDPSKYPDLVVRVTGFSAFFASLSPEFRQLVVDRLIVEQT